MPAHRLKEHVAGLDIATTVSRARVASRRRPFGRGALITARNREPGQRRRNSISILRASCKWVAAELAVAPEPAQQVFPIVPAPSRRPGEPDRSAPSVAYVA